jgi:hypothetical protein
LINKITKSPNFSNKQFGIFKKKWDIIKNFRTKEYLDKYGIGSDYATTLFTANNGYYSYYAIIPRTTDIGLFHKLGCTTLHWKKEVPLDTVKILTFDDYNVDDIEKYEVVNEQEYLNIRNKYFCCDV